MNKLIIGLIAGLFLTAGFVLPAHAAQQTRNYMLVFEAVDYTAQLKEGVEEFFNNVFQDGDQLIVVTPVKLIGYSKQKLSVPKKKLIADLIKEVKTDISSGSVRARDILSNMESIAREVSQGGTEQVIKGTLETYYQLRKILASMRSNYGDNLEKYAKIFMRVKGENHLVMIMPQQFRAVPNRDTMERFRSNPQEIGFKAAEVFLSENFKSGIDVKRLASVFKYANVRFHYFYMKPKSIKNRRDFQFIDNMGDLYTDFTKLCKETNGLKSTSAKPAVFVKQMRQLVLEGKVTTEVVDETPEK